MIRERVRTSLLVGLCCLLLYNANRRAIPAGDTYPARYLPFAILHHHTVLLDPIAKIAAQGRGESAFWMVRLPGGHTISLYPVATPLLVTPLYLPAVAYLHVRGWTDVRLDTVARVMEKAAASLLAALSAALLYLLLRRRAPNGVALLLTAAYAFGTTTWVISSQALWQHGVGELLLIGILLLVTGLPTTPRALAAGLLCGLVAANRPPDVLLGAALGVYALVWAGRRRVVPLAAAAAVPMLAVLAYNLRFGGNVLGGYGVIGGIRFFRHDLFTGLAGLLVSPTRGLFVFSPFLLFLALAWRDLPRDRDERRLTLAIAIGVALQIALYAKVDWRSGMSWGPRYMTDTLPLLVWLLVPVVSALRGFGRVCFLAATGVAIAIEAIGAFAYSPSFDLPIFAADRGPAHHDMRAAFAWRNTPILTSLQHGLAPAELAFPVRGAFDAIEAGGRAMSAVRQGEPAAATGWALAGHSTPGKVMVSIDGRQFVGTQAFVDRPDVRATLQEASPAGWRIPVDTASLEPGEHHLTALAWASANADEGHYLDERTLTVRAAESTLEESFRMAAARIREHQQAEGFWLTRYTSGTRFVDARPEMNTFLTSLLVDVLAPVAARSGLDDSVQRARRHLTNQIEPTGLVRYHGLPDAPWIGTLGCAITPDTDDTALVWRIAPAPDRSRLNAALQTIGRYRTPEGLYRSWLAPREAYQCLDPGSDPNPADVAIQMHLLLLLSEVRPAAGRALCEALRPLVDQNRIWVYYAKTPLVPILRLPDLRRAGCELQLPESRLRTDVPGQEIWVTAVQLLGSAPDRARLGAVLRELARDGFADIRSSPPLFYHNDLTATVSRYYWSEDFGYALWLRLYDEYDPLHSY